MGARECVVVVAGVGASECVDVVTGVGVSAWVQGSVNVLSRVREWVRVGVCAWIVMFQKGDFRLWMSIYGQ